jgi:hypothetical protein
MTESKKKKSPDDQYDSPWKEAIEEYFQECMAFFFPNIHTDIDWSKEYEFLDKELQQIVPQGAVSEQHVDKLIKVHRISGEENLVLVHIDVQSQHDTDFAKRMYHYNTRLFEIHNKSVATFVIYGDESKTWQPKEYKRELWDCELTFKFPSVKLMDYNISDLEQNDSPFAVVVLAHRYTKATKNKPNERFDFKWRLIRMLYERGYDQDRVRSLFRYINWMLALPLELEAKLDDRITEYEEAHKMAYITTIERRGIEKGLLQTFRENVVEVLMLRFGKLKQELVERINGIEQVVLLKTLLKKAVLIDSLPEFEQFVAELLDNPQDSLNNSSSKTN